MRGFFREAAPRLLQPGWGGRSQGALGLAGGLCVQQNRLLRWGHTGGCQDVAGAAAWGAPALLQGRGKTSVHLPCTAGPSWECTPRVKPALGAFPVRFVGCVTVTGAAPSGCAGVTPPGHCWGAPGCVPLQRWGRCAGNFLDGNVGNVGSLYPGGIFGVFLPSFELSRAGSPLSLPGCCGAGAEPCCPLQEGSSPALPPRRGAGWGCVRSPCCGILPATELPALVAPGKEKT